MGTRETAQTKLLLTCEHCGHTGLSVEASYEHVGGQGEVLQTLCRDVVGCWRRWDRKNNL